MYGSYFATFAAVALHACINELQRSCVRIRSLLVLLCKFNMRSVCSTKRYKLCTVPLELQVSYKYVRAQVFPLQDLAL